jgi:hypothetical protein
MRRRRPSRRGVSRNGNKNIGYDQDGRVAPPAGA